jgi:hypothetical protein
MNADTFAFLEALFAPCEQGFLTFTAIHPGGQHPTPSRHVPIYDPPCLTHTLERLTLANAQGWGAYVAIATRKTNLGRWRRGGKGDLLALPALFADIDRPPDVVLREIQGFRPIPSCIVATGRGVHLYFFLDHGAADMVLARRILRGLATVLRGDVLSPAQSMRLVGTHNTKQRAGGERCHLLELHPERRYTLDDFVCYAETERKTCSRCPVIAHDPGELNPLLVAALVEHFAAKGFRQRGAWLNGPCVYPDRHTHGDARPSFGYNLESGYGFCFRCGTLLTKDICFALNIHPVDYGGLFF